MQKDRLRKSHSRSLDELVIEGARRVLAAALEAEVKQYTETLRHLRDESDPALVVRNGKSHHERTAHTGAGSIKIPTPRVDDQRPEHTFASKILPPYMRRSPRLEEAVPPCTRRDCRQATSRKRWKRSWGRQWLDSRPQPSRDC